MLALTPGTCVSAWSLALDSGYVVDFSSGLHSGLEPAWHRRQRRRRTSARRKLSVFQRTQVLTTRRLRLLECLVKHHSWHFWTAPRHLRLLVAKMSKWDCQFCAVKNRMSSLHCMQCQTHWSRAWVAPQSQSKSRSKSRQRRARRRDNKEKKDTADTTPGETEETDYTMFSQKTPWILSTPQSRSRQVEVREAEGTPTPAAASIVPPQAQPTASTVSKISPQEEEYRQQLISMKKLRGHLPTEMEEELVQLNRLVPEPETLTHRHLNQHHRLEKAVAGLKAKIMGLDKDWQEFVRVANQKFGLHKDQYCKLRSEHLKQLQEKMEELQQVRQEISKVSQGLTEAPQHSLDSLQQPQMTDEAMAALMTAKPFPEVEEVISDDGYQDAQMDEIDTAANVEEKDPNNTRPAIKPFTRPMTSPSKVHQSHLKQATKEMRELQAKEKAKKDGKDNDDTA